MNTKRLEKMAERSQEEFKNIIYDIDLLFDCWHYGYLILAITNECFSQSHGLFYEVFEDTCYILCVFCTFNVCYCINKRVEKWKYKVLIV